MEHHLSRLWLFLLALALVATSCSSSSEDQVTTADVSQSTERPVVDNSAVNAAELAEPAEPQPQAVSATPLLLPDPQRWVVVQDWSDTEAAGQPGPDAEGRDLHGLQLDVAPLDDAGVPQLGRRISLNYWRGSLVDFDRQWGDASSMGEPLEFEIENGFGRSVHNAEMGFATAQIWNSGTFVSIQTMDPDADLVELARSVTEVDGAQWVAARAGAQDQRLAAIQAAMRIVGPVAPHGSPLPHWVLPEPWEVQWVTDKTIWTPEQHAQSAAFSEANRPRSATGAAPGEYQTWRFGFADTAEAAAMQFVPQVTIGATVLNEAPNNMFPTNYEKISALGLDGVISPVGGTSWLSVELGTGEVYVNVRTAHMSQEGVRQFLDAIEFASDDPLDGFVVSDPRFQLIDLSEWEDRPASWHASWKLPDGPEAVTSVWRLTIPELRTWLMSRGDGLDVPDDVWEMVAAEEVIDFGHGTTYDVSVGLLFQLRGIEKGELIPIELQDWVTLVEPVNTDPVNPR